MGRLRKIPVYIIFLSLFFQTYAIDNCIPSPGIYENSNKFIIISSENQPSKGVYKLFYSFYYDGEYAFETDNEPFCVVEIENKLYTDYWIRYDFQNIQANEKKYIFWLPAGNMKEISLNPPFRKESLYGYCVFYENDNEIADVLKIHYWITDCEYSDKEVYIPLEDGTSLPIPEFTKIGSFVYKCINGIKPIVRHAEKIGKLPFDAVYSPEGDIMASGKFYSKISEEETLLDEISAHNSIVYPPRFSILEMKEPSIYKKLENMKINE